MKKKIRAVLIGLGKIGFKYDNNFKNKIRTHFKALKNEKKIQLVGIFENKIKKNLIKKIGNIKYFSNLNKIESLNPELVVIAVPTNSHYQVFKKLLKIKSIKFIICEKPFTSNPVDANKIIYLYKKRKTKIYINYIRRGIPSFQKLRFLIKNKNLLPPFQIKINYSKNLIRNGCHFIDLIQFLFGKIKKIYRNKQTKKIFLKINNGTVLLNFLGKKKNINYLEIKCKNKSILIDSKSRFIENNFDNKSKINFADPLKSRKEMDYYQKFNLQIVLKNYLEGKEKDIICTPEKALDTLTLINNKILNYR